MSDILLGNGEVFVGNGIMKVTGLPCLLFIKGEPGPIGRKSAKYEAGTKVYEEEALARIVIPNKETWFVVFEQLAKIGTQLAFGDK